MSGPLPAAARPLTVPLSWIYRLAVTARNRRYDVTAPVRAAVPVISVGNITTGGVGKSPMVRWIAARLVDHGHRPVIAMRGYRAPPDGPGDEESEARAALPGVAVVASPDRAHALARHLCEHPAVDCAILDDGFQHRRLHRDLDLVLVDATAGTLADRLLPAGHLREPLAGLRRADAIIVTRAARRDSDLAAGLARHHGREPLAWARHAWSRLHVHGRADQAAHVDVAWLRGRRVVTMLGVGNPAAIRAQIEEAGATVADDLPVRDHARYDAKTIARVAERLRAADALVVTPKDWVKLRDLIDCSVWPVPVVVPELELDVHDGAGDLLDLVLACIRREGAATASVPGA